MFTVAIFSLLILGLPSIVSAQWGNGGYGNNGYYGDIRGTLRDLKMRSRNFEKSVDRDRSFRDAGYNNGGYYNRNAYGDLKKLLDRFGDAAGRLDSRYGNGRDLSRSSNEARNLLDLGSQADRMLYSFGNNGYWQGEWGQIQNELRIVANTYGMSYNGNYRYDPRNRNRNGNWGNRQNLPSWWPF